jgi:hypothetical protein
MERTRIRGQPSPDAVGRANQTRRGRLAQPRPLMGTALSPRNLVVSYPASMSALRSAGLIAPVITLTVSAMLMTLGFRMAARLPMR